MQYMVLFPYYKDYGLFSLISSLLLCICENIEHINI